MAAAAAKGDITQPEIVKDVLVSLCRPPRTMLRSALDTHFAEGATLRSALFQVRGKEKIYQFFRAWQAAFDDHLQVLDVAVHGNRALARIRHNLQPRLLNAQLPGVGVLPAWAKRAATFPFIVAAEFTFEDTPRGKKIVKWEEDISAYTLIYSLPFAEQVWGSVVEPAGGFVASQAGAAFDALAPTVDKLLNDAGWRTGLRDI